jgi:hypothetical protein
MMGNKLAKCKGCQADILWIQTKAGKMMPCDPEEIVVCTFEGEVVKGHIPHWATCPQAERFKKNEL